MKKKLLLGLTISGLIIFSSCGPSSITVSSRPERPYYMRPASPGVGYVWMDGNWVARGGHYRWHEGHWARTRNRAWISGSWESRPSGWYWRRGHWR